MTQGWDGKERRDLSGHQLLSAIAQLIALLVGVVALLGQNAALERRLTSNEIRLEVLIKQVDILSNKLESTKKQP